MNTYILGFIIIAALIIASFMASKLGSSKEELVSMIKTGTKKAMILVQVFFLIGILTAAWMASGTIPYLIKLGIDVISPHLFVVSAFLLCTVMSFVTGSSFGTTNTFGVVLIVIARASGVDLWLTAGAVLCGVYVGDRCSPMSSALLLLSTVTGTDHYENVKMACKTSIVPVSLTALIFWGFSMGNPMQQVSSSVTDGIASTFRTGIPVLLPVTVLFAACLLKINVKIAIGMGALTGALIAVGIQKYPIPQLLRFLVLGFELPDESPVAQLVRGGGMKSMAAVIFVVFFACLLAEVINGSGLLKRIPFLIHTKKSPSRLSLFLHTAFVGLLMSMIGCNQVMPIIITAAAEKNAYEHLPPAELVRDVSKTAMLLPMIVPWNIAILTPVTMLGLSGIGYIPYLFFLFTMVLWALFQYAFSPRYRT